MNGWLKRDLLIFFSYAFLVGNVHFCTDITTLASFACLNKLLHDQLPLFTSMDILFLLAFLYIFIYIFSISDFGYGFVLPPETLFLNDISLYIHVRP